MIVSDPDIRYQIPKILLQTSPDAPHPAYVKRLRRYVPNDWQYCHFTDADIFAFFDQNPLEFVPDIRNKFDLMPTGPHKADLFRYFFLYLKGGVFIDSDAVLCRDIERIVDNYSFFSCNSIFEGTIFQGFIGCSPQHPIIRDALIDAYNVEPAQLVDYYHLLCRHMYEFVQNSTVDGVQLYTERVIDRITTDVVDDQGRLLLLHFNQHAHVPRFYFPALARMKYFVCHLNHTGTPHIVIRPVAEFFLTVGRATKISWLNEIGTFMWKLRFFKRAS